MSEPDLSDIRAAEAILHALNPLRMDDQVRVLSWVIEKLDLALDMRLAMRDSRATHRNYIELAWERVPHLLESIPEFVAAAAPSSMADRVLSVATFLQMRSDDADRAIVTGREINGALRRMRLEVSNVTDCMYTLMKRNPPHMIEVGRVAEGGRWKTYRVTESGIDYVYKQIVEMSTRRTVERRR